MRERTDRDNRRRLDRRGGLRRCRATAHPPPGASVGVAQLFSSDLTLIGAALAALALTTVAILRDLGTYRLRPCGRGAESYRARRREFPYLDRWWSHRCS